MIVEIKTWDDLRKFLNDATPLFLAQTACIQTAEETGLRPIIAMGTITEFEFEPKEARSCDDNGFHPNQLIGLTDYNPFTEDGTFFWDLEETIEFID